MACCLFTFVKETKKKPEVKGFLKLSRNGRYFLAEENLIDHL